MHLGFYYHVPVVPSAEGLKIPAYLGVFVDSLASEVEKLTIFMHEANDYDTMRCDYILKSKNLQFITLGLKTPAWDRFLFPWRTLFKIRNAAAECDVLLIRGPSPLAPSFYNFFHNQTIVVFLLVGDYIDGAKNLNLPSLRVFAIKLLIYRNEFQLRRKIRHTMTLVNSAELLMKYRKITSNIHKIKTTTLVKADFYYRKDTCIENHIKLLYTGVLTLNKGLMELIEATSLLIKDGYNVSVHFVGGEYDSKSKVKDQLVDKAHKLNLVNSVFFYGYLKKGEELNSMYRTSDIYILPSYYEGFPRTIWEALANCLPVIATSVGSIPYSLVDHKDALLIPPRDSKSIYLAIQEVITNSALRSTLIENGLKLARESTLEIQNKKIVAHIEDYLSQGSRAHR